jgi:hypothetical protein
MVRFSNFTIAEALNKILSSHDRIFIYEETQSDSDELLPSRLKEVRIYTPLPKGTTRGGTSEHSTVANSKSTPSTKTTKNSSAQRKVAKRPSSRTKGKQTVASLADNLKDSDYNVRLDAIRNLRNVGNADAIGHLTTALEDKNPEVRKAAENALQELQEEKTDTTNDPDEIQQSEGSPEFSYSVSGDPSNVTVDINLSDVQEPLITSGLWIEYDASQWSINADINSGDGAWDSGMSQTVNDPKGPGTFMITTGNLSTVKPDGNNDIGVASLQFQCKTGNCSPSEVKIGTVPGFDSVVGNSSGVYDKDMKGVSFSIP